MHLEAGKYCNPAAAAMFGILPTKIANSIFGALFVAACLTCLSSGAAYMQFIRYFTSRHNDRSYLVYTMIALVFITTLHTILVCHVAYYYLIMEYGNPRSAAVVVWSESVNGVFIEFSNLLIRLLFARRVWLLSQGNVWATVSAIVFSIATFGVAAAVAIMLQYLPDPALLNDKATGGIYLLERRLIWSSFAFNFAAELVLTVSLCYYLYTAKTGFKKTNSLIYTLIVYTIHTGLIILIGSTISTISYLTVPDSNNYCNIFYFMESSLYVNAYLAGLSARDKMKSEDYVSLHLSQINPNTTSNTVVSQGKNGIQIGIDRSIEVDGVPALLVGNGKI